MPLRWRRQSQSVAFVRAAGRLRSDGLSPAQFLPMDAPGGEHVHTIGHTDGKPIALICDDDQSVDPDALLGVLDGPAEAAWSGVTVGEADPIHGLRRRLLPKGAIIDKHHTRIVITYP